MPAKGLPLECAPPSSSPGLSRLVRRPRSLARPCHVKRGARDKPGMTIPCAYEMPTHIGFGRWTRSLGLSNSRSMDKTRIQRARHPRRRRRRRTRRSPSKAGCARGATPRPASRSCTCRTARRSIRVQVVAPNTLPNYTDEVLKLTAGCAVEATGTIVPSPAQGPAVRDAGDRDQGDRLGRRPRHLSDPAEAAHAGVPARGRAPAPAHQRDRRGDARAAHARARRSTASSTRTASSGSTRRSSPRPTRKARARCSACRRSISRTCRARRQGKIDFSTGFLRPRGVPHRVGPAQRRGLLPRAVQGLHVRADVPRRELQHQPPSRRVLDDRAGDRVRRSRPTTRRSPSGCSSTSSRRCSNERAGRPGLLRRAHREGRWSRSSKASSTPNSCAWITARRSRCSRSAKQKFEFPVQWGIDLQSRARALPHREARQEARDRDELPEGHQGVLHARERRRQDRRGDGRAGARHRRDHRRQPARGAPRRARCAHDRARPSTRSTTAGTATCAATAPCRTPASASASSARSPT